MGVLIKFHFKEYMTDPDKGRWDYEFNQLGQLTWQENGNDQETVTTYDLIGRVKTVKRYVGSEGGSLEGDVTYTYDSAALGNTGKSTAGLASVYDAKTGTGYALAYYDDGKISDTHHAIEGGIYTESNTYDSIGRLQTHTDASGKGVEYYYNNYGYQYAIKDLNSGVVYWQAESQDQFGNVTNYNLHNNRIQGGSTYAPQTGLADFTAAGDMNNIMAIGYHWDQLGNLEYRDNIRQGKKESFEYDDLNRLRKTFLTGVKTAETQYFDNGNIKYKQGVGYYCYNSNDQAHAVKDIKSSLSSCGSTPTAYGYDNNGNMTSGRGRTIDYSTFDKPTKITQGGNTVWFSYGPEVNRYKRVEHNGTDVTTTYYVGNVEFIEKNGIQTIKRMIGGVVEVSELFNSKGESILDYTYLFKDHLGSVVATTNHKGQNTQQLAFDAWGQRRPANWSTPSYYDGYAMGLTGITNSLLMPLPVNTGFTGHEHVDSVGLIHMNGRIYDPVLGRFLSADPFIQYPSVVQNLNRYSYLMNNPLNATDPTGYFVDKIVQQGFVQAVTTVALTAIHPALGAAYVAYNAAGSAKSMMQAAQVWQGGGDLPWGDMLVNSLFSQAIGGMMGMIGGGIVESNRQARIAAELEALLGKIGTDLGGIHTTGSGGEGGGGVAELAKNYDNLSKSEQDAVSTLQMHHSKQGEINKELGPFKKQRDADIAAHKLYNPLSQMVDDEAQWFVLETSKDNFEVTYASVGTLSPEGNARGVDVNVAYSKIRKSFKKSQIVRSGHTHWDGNQKFSGKDTRWLIPIAKKILKNRRFVLSVSTSNGSYRELNLNQALDSLTVDEPKGSLIQGVKIGH